MRTNGILAGLRIVELSAFVAVPLAGLTLAQLGADVIRVDPIGGGLDIQRWPLSSTGQSLYWLGLNKGKRSIAMNTKLEQARELVRRLVVTGGDSGGVLITNLGPHWLSYERLRSLRDDVIVVTLYGNRDGTPAVDYTVNASVGFPRITGDGETPTNHVLPAWDVVAGNQVALAALAALLHRRSTGQGQHVELSLSDVALATVGHLGYIAEAFVNETDREAFGNYVYGSYGRDFVTADGQRVMVTAMTSRQWESLIAATDTEDQITEIEVEHSVDLGDEGQRFMRREDISTILAPWFASRTLAEVAEALNENRVTWGPYQSFRELVNNDTYVAANPLFEEIDQPGVGRYPAAGMAPLFGAFGRPKVRPAPILGGDTDSVLVKCLGLESRDLSRLQNEGVI